MDPIYFDGAYYLGPDKGADLAYRLLSEAMKQTGRCALAKWSARGKQYLVLLRPLENGIVMQQLLYSDEVRQLSEVPLPDVELKDAELALARQLVEQIAADTFRPENYEDDVRKRMQAAMKSSFRLMQSSELYASYGASSDIQHANGIFAMALEMGNSFQPSERDVGPIVADGTAASLVLIDHVRGRALGHVRGREHTA